MNINLSSVLLGLFIGIAISCSIYLFYVEPYQKAEKRAALALEISATYEIEAALLNEAPEKLKEKLLSNQCGNLRYLESELAYFQNQKNTLGELYTELLISVIGNIKSLHKQGGAVSCK